MIELPDNLAALEAAWRSSEAATLAAMERMKAATTGSPVWCAAFDEYIRCSEADSAAWAAYTAARDAWMDERRRVGYSEYRQSLRNLMYPALRSNP